MSFRCLALALSLGFAASALFSDRAAAVTRIRNEVWSSGGVIPSLPQMSSMTLNFEADLTENDAYHGVQFSLEVPEPGGHAQTVVSFFTPLLDLPYRIPARFEVLFSLSCQPSGTLVWASGPSCTMTYVHPQGSKIVREPLAGRVISPADIQEQFGLIACDENGAVGRNPMPQRAMRCAGAGSAAAYSIGVYFDPAGTQCRGSIHPGVPGTVYILAKVDEGTGGIAGAEFRFFGAPNSWHTFPVASREILAIGDPLGDGVIAGFPCRSSQSDRTILLYTVLVLASEAVNDVTFTISGRVPASNPQFQCPLVVGCEPNFDKYCVEGISCDVNPTRPGACKSPITAVQETSWSVVKTLYRGGSR